MLMWFLWTVVAGLLLSGAHVVATCLPAGWLTPNQGLQSPSDLVIHAQQLQQDLWPQCQSMLASDAPAAAMPHADQQKLAMCQELDSILTDLQSSWHALHHHSQACSILGVTPGLPSCSSSDTPQSMPASSQPPDASPPSIPQSPQRHRQQQQQLDAQHQCWQPGADVGDGVSSSNRSPATEGQHVPRAVHAKTQTAQAQHSQHALFPGPIFTPSVEWHQQQQQQQAGHGGSAHQQPLGLLQQQAGQPDERLVLAQESTQGAAHGYELWGGVLLSAQQLWDNLIYDTQVVQKQLESEAQMGGQACRSCLAPHLHKSHREVVSEVVALLVLGALCASGLLLVATFYRRRQSTRRQTQQSIATQRLRHFEKLQQHRRQEEEVRRSVAESNRRGDGLPWLQRPQPAPPVTVKHTRHRVKASEPTIPSSPSASSSHSEAIGTQVRPHSNSKLNKAGKPKRARSAQRSSVNVGPVDSLHQGLGRSRSDLSTEAAQHGSFEMPQQSMHSMQGTEAPMQDLPGSSAPSTPSSMAGSTSFNPFHRSPSTHQAPSPSYDSSKATSAASVDGSVDSVHAKQAGSKRRNRHKGKSRAAKKPPPAKRRFIPGLDSEFDPAIHELPTPPQDPATDTVRQKGAEQPLGCSDPSSCSSALPELQARRQLSVDAPIFVPVGYAKMGSFCRSPSHFPSTQLPDWQPQSGPHHFEGQGSPVPYQVPRETETGSLLPEPALAPDLSQAPNLPFNSHLELVSPMGCPWDYGDHGVYTLPSLPKPSPRNSPTSVLPACLPLPSEIGNPVFGTSISGSGCTSPFSTAGEHMPQLGVVGNSRGWGLPPLLEESIGSPFPGMLSRTSDQPNPTTAVVSPVAGSIFSASASSGTSMPEQPQLSSLPGFNSIWRTAKSPDMHSAEDTWQSFTADKSNASW